MEIIQHRLKLTRDRSGLDGGPDVFAVPVDHATSELRMGKLDWWLSEVWERTILLKSSSTY